MDYKEFDLNNIEYRSWWHLQSSGSTLHAFSGVVHGLTSNVMCRKYYKNVILWIITSKMLLNFLSFVKKVMWAV